MEAIILLLLSKKIEKTSKIFLSPLYLQVQDGTDEFGDWTVLFSEGNCVLAMMEY